MKSKLLKFFKAILFTLLAAMVIIFSIYSVAWYTFTKRAEIYLEQAWQDKTLTITGEQPHFTGYPFVPTAIFQGNIKHVAGLTIEAPELIFTGFPVPTQIQNFEAAKGLKIQGDLLERDLNFDYAFLQFRLPGNLPATDRKDDIAAWQKSDSPIEVHQIVLKAGKIYARGTGTISLDDDLQLKADIAARVVGMDALLDELAIEKGEKTIGMARSFLNMMSKIDEKTGEKYFETSLKIQKRGIYFGPMMISKLPELKWK